MHASVQDPERERGRERSGIEVMCKDEAESGKGPEYPRSMDSAGTPRGP